MFVFKVKTPEATLSQGCCGAAVKAPGLVPTQSCHTGLGEAPCWDGGAQEGAAGAAPLAVRPRLRLPLGPRAFPSPASSEGVKMLHQCK